MAKIPKDLSDKDMMQGHEAEETLAETMLRQERQAEERAHAAAAKEPPADLARAAGAEAGTRAGGRDERQAEDPPQRPTGNHHGDVMAFS